MQHFVFGSIFSASWRSSRDPVPSESISRAVAAHARGRQDQAVAARLVEASATLVPTDEGGAAVAPWVTEPLPASILAGSGSGVGEAGLAHVRDSGTSGVAPGSEEPQLNEVPTVDTFLQAFGPIAHVSAAHASSAAPPS